MSDEWSWRFSSTARSNFESIEADERERIEDKLDEICENPWRDPPEYGEPLQGSPYRKVSVGEFRLSVTFLREDEGMIVARVKHRGGAYTADD